MRRLLAFAVLVLLWSGGAHGQTPGFEYLCIWNGLQCNAANGNLVSATNPLPISGSFSATLSGFSPATTGTPISVTSAGTGVTGTLPAGTVVVASNVGSTNGAYCKLGASATTSDQLIPPTSWFAFTVGVATQLTCITGSSTTTVNMVGGSGLPTGSGGGGGGSGGSVTQGTSPWIVAGGGTAGSAATGVATIQGIASMTPVQVSQATAANLNAAVVGTGTAGSAAGGVLTVQGVASMTKLLVTPDSVALPANQSVNVAQVNGVTTSTGTGAVGTGSQRVAVGTDTATIAGSAPGTAGSASANVVTIQGIASMTKLLVTPDANSSVNLAQVGGTNTVNGGVAGSQSVGGTVATNVAITANPMNLGAQAVSSENAAVTTARQVQLVADLVGKLIVLPYANPENFVSGVITSAMTGTTSTSLIAAPTSGLRNYITQCTFSNTHASQGTMMILQDGSGGTTIYSGPAAPAFGGATITFPTPLRQPSTATALFVQNVTTGANTFVACSGYKGA